MKITEKMRKELTVPPEYKKEFRKRDYRYNNTAFLFAASLIFLLVLSTFFTSRAALADTPEKFNIVWPVLAAMIFITAVYIAVLLLRRKFPFKLIVCDIFDSVFFLAAGALSAFLYYFMFKVAGDDRPDILLIAFFFIIFFARFDLRITLGILTLHFGMSLTVLIMSGTQPPIGCATAYIIAVHGAVIMWIMRVRSFVSEKNFEALVTSDFLTGVRNRRGFDLVFETAWNGARKNGGKLTLYMIDIDNFKNYNDLYGHVEGDKCLKAVAEAIADAMRKGDCVARYGGEEFAVLVSDTERLNEEMIAKRILASVASKGIAHGDSVAPYVTVSIGCADCIPSEGDLSCTGLIQMADRALYRAKEDGRNRIIYYEDMK